jgi:3-oxoacyl-[acyl-carrier protein] reductase
MNISLLNRNAVVCGATQGIGLAVARELAVSGASVTIIARNEQALRDVAASLPASQGQSHGWIVADFSEPENLRLKIASWLQEDHSAHILVNNTGGPPGGPIAEAAVQAFESAFRQHLVCNHILAQALIPGMKASAYGRIVNIISTSVKQPLKGLGVSNTIRAAVANWSKTLSFELAPHGITVNNVLPGATRTTRLSSLIESKSLKTGIDAAILEHEMKSEIPMNRFAEPLEIAAAVAFLASPAASYITGINLPVDGGRTGSL